MICAAPADAQFLRALERMQTDESMTDRTVATQLQDRMIAEADELTPHNRFTVHDFPNAGHLGPPDPTRVTDVLHGLPL